MEWIQRHPILMWSLAWAANGAALLLAGVFDEPRSGPLAPAVIVGAISWAIAGGATFGRGRALRAAVIWSAAFLLALWLAAMWGTWFDRNTIAGVSSAGFIGALFGWSVGAAAGTLVSLLATSPRSPARALAIAAVWGASFLIAGFFALVVGLLLGQLASAALAFVREEIVLSLGFAVGCGICGALAAKLGSAADHAFTRSADGPVFALGRSR
jgi:hypothetical protein